MLPLDRSNRLRESGLTPTIQRLAILDCLEKTTVHPTADQVLLAVRETFPSVSRATVYNTLEALARVGLILRITVDPAVARYDADLGPHAHFRCRLCCTVYDVVMDKDLTLNDNVHGHRVESVRTYAYGVCRACLQADAEKRMLKDSSKASTKRKQARSLPPNASTSPTKSDKENVSKTLSLSDSSSEEGGESPDA